MVNSKMGKLYLSTWEPFWLMFLVIFYRFYWGLFSFKLWGKLNIFTNPTQTLFSTELLLGKQCGRNDGGNKAGEGFLHQTLEAESIYL